MTVRYKSLSFLGFPDYQVSTDGTVWSRLNGRWGTLDDWHKVKGWTFGRYRGVTLCNGKRKRKRYYVHQLVLLAFVGPCPKGMQCRHFPDRDRSNNRLENLSWGTPKQDHQDKLVHGTHLEGGRHPNAILTDHQAAQIKNLAAAGNTNKKIAAMTGVKYGLVRRIVLGERYRTA